MTLIPPTITGVSFVGTFNPQTLSPLTEGAPLVLPFSFSSVANLKILQGSFLPANNIIYPFEDIDSSIAPNFLIILCDSTLKITMETDSVSAIPINSLDVSKFFMWVSPTGSPTPFSLWIDGRIGVLYPMDQTITANYQLIYGQATIT